MGGYLPSALTEVWEPSRDFAFLRLPTSGARCIVALSGTMPQVMVISSEGYFYSYSIDLENGGECSLLKQYRYAPSCTRDDISTDPVCLVSSTPTMNHRTNELNLEAEVSILRWNHTLRITVFVVSFTHSSITGPIHIACSTRLGMHVTLITFPVARSVIE